MMEGAAMMKLLLFLSLIACLFAPWGMALGDVTIRSVLIGLASYLGKLILLALLLALFETSIAKMRIFRVSEFLATAMLLGLLAVIFLFVTKGL
jgi:formate hydrogenlyase subunit 4